MSEPKVNKLIQVCKIAILRGKTSRTHLYVHLNLLKQMYLRSQQNESLTKPEITLVSQSHKSILRLVMRQWKVFTTHKQHTLIKKNLAIVKLFNLLDRVINKKCCNLLTHLSSVNRG